MNWKSKINLVILTTIMLCASVGLAYTVGQIVTPKQFDNQDFLIAPLNIEVTSKEKAGDIIFVYFAYNSFDYNTTGNNWVVTRNQTRTPYSIDKYVACRKAKYTKAQCIANAKAEVKSDIITFRNNTRQWLEDQKTKEYSEEINPEDLDIPTGELN